MKKKYNLTYGIIVIIVVNLYLVIFKFSGQKDTATDLKTDVVRRKPIQIIRKIEVPHVLQPSKNRQELLRLKSQLSPLNNVQKPLLVWNDIKDAKLPLGCKQYFQDAQRQRKIDAFAVTDTNSSQIMHHQLCLVTQLNYGRMGMLELLLSRWKGPISAAVYVQNNEYYEMKQKLGALLAERTGYGVSLHFVTADGTYYPVNYLRNVALQNANCAFVFLSDIDFIPSVNLYDELLRLSENNATSQNKTLWVVPGFEQSTQTDVPKDFEELVQIWEKIQAKPFHLRPNTKNAHGPTNFETWRTAKKPYKVKYVEGFEPYVLVEKRLVPPYIDLFLTRYGDKVSYFVELNARGFEFVVLPEVFVVHFPHPTTDTSSLFKAVGRCTSFVFKQLSSKAKTFQAIKNNFTQLSGASLDTRKVT